MKAKFILLGVLVFISIITVIQAQKITIQLRTGGTGNITNGSYLLKTGDTATGNYMFDSGTLFIDSVQDRVGIGTTEPEYPLDVNGDIGFGIGNGLLTQDGTNVVLQTIGSYGLSFNNIMIINTDGFVGVWQGVPTSLMDLAGTHGYDQLQLETPYTPSGTSDTNGNIGQIVWDDDYVYVKTSAGWKRTALSTW